MADARILFEARITFEVSGGVTHAPMVHATVHGIPTRLILDTGSSDHILTTELAEAAGLPMTPGEEGTDSTGASVASWNLGEQQAQIAGREFTLESVVAIAPPAPFPGWGIGGILSPQHLDPAAWIVLDLAGDRLVLLDGDEAAVAAWLMAGGAAFRLERLVRIDDETIMVRAAVAPFAPVATLLDSGARRTSFSSSAVPGLAAGPMVSSGRGVGGEEGFGAELRDRQLIAGESSMPLPTLLVVDGIEGRDGLIGMDLLRGTVLTVSRDLARPVLWQLPAAPAVDADLK